MYKVHVNQAYLHFLDRAQNSKKLIINNLLRNLFSLQAPESKNLKLTVPRELGALGTYIFSLKSLRVPAVHSPRLNPKYAPEATVKKSIVSEF